MTNLWTRFIPVLAGVLLLTVSCHLLVSQPQIIMAGYYRTGIIRHACCWKNGARIDLPDGNGFSSEAFAAYAEGRDIYVAGTYSTNGSDIIACYWKNGTRVDLPCNPASIPTVTSISLLGGVVYVAGNDDGLPCLWVDGVRTPLSMTEPPLGATPAGTGQVYDMKIYGKTNRVLGFYDISSAWGRYCIWTNGVPADLNLTVDLAEMNSLYVWRQTNYIAGRQGGAPCYWENDVVVPLNLPVGASDATPTGITVADDRVYVTGFFTRGLDSFPCLWQGTVPVELALPADALSGNAYAVVVREGTVYISGSVTIGAGTTVCYWVNGQPFALPLNGVTGAWTRSLFVH